MKKSLMFLLCATIILAVVIFAAFPHKEETGKSSLHTSSSVLDNSTSNSGSSQGSSEIITAASAKETDFYIIKEYNGHIGIFKNDETTPFKEYDIPVDMLPQQNQQELKNGYKKFSMQDVEKLIEDFDG